MAFVKVQKSKAYFKRYQTQYRRRREGKTDYWARRNLIVNDKDKYNTPKYRFVPRITNSRVICQITYATLRGDQVLCQASSTELKRYGLTAGLTNYSSAYATGLLLARRLLTQLKMDNFYKGNDKVDGTLYDVSAKPNSERTPFKAILDVGLVRTTTGARVFGALKGAADGGLYIPHKEKRFPGYHFGTGDGEKDKFDPKVHRERIFGGHIDKYMKKIKANVEAYNRQFSTWDKTLKAAGVDTVEKLYTKVFAEIRKDAKFVKKAVKQAPNRTKHQKRTKKIGRVGRKNNAYK